MQQKQWVVPDRSGYSTLTKQIGIVSLANGGPRLSSTRRAAMPVDYNSGEPPHRVKQEFSPNHRHVPFFKLIIMFSGIIEEFATVVAIHRDRENIDFTLKCSFVDELKIDQSVAHNGVCLTVVSIENGTYTVTAMKETLDRTNLGLLKIGNKVNVERSMLMNGRLDGHIVQGHVDETARCIAVEDADGSTYFTFEYPENREMAKKGYFTVDKGSVTVNGVSLTVCNPTSNTFQVAIIPYTFEHTNFCDIRVDSVVNIEFDILGKYIARLQQL